MSNTQVALVTHQKADRRLGRRESEWVHRRALVESETVEGTGVSLVDGIASAQPMYFLHWIDDKMSSMASAAQDRSFGSMPVVNADDLLVHEEITGESLPARGNNSEFDDWMEYGDDHSLWPAS